MLASSCRWGCRISRDSARWRSSGAWSEVSCREWPATGSRTSPKLAPLLLCLLIVFDPWNGNLILENRDYWKILLENLGQLDRISSRLSFVNHIPFSGPHKMPLFDFVLECGMWDPIIAASSVNAHLASLHGPHSLDQTVSIVISVLSSFWPRTFTTSATTAAHPRLRLVLRRIRRFRRRRLLRLSLSRRIPATLVRIRLGHHWLTHCLS